MTAKEFLTDKTLQAVEIACDRIISIVVDNLAYALSVNVSDLPTNTSVIRVTQFVQTDDIVTVETVSLNLATTNML